MLITTEGTSKEWQVELKERTMADIRARSGEAKNEAFPAVARISALNQSIYDLFVSPVVRRMATEQSAELRRQMHPMRLRRTLLSDNNPAMAPVATLAEQARQHRAPAASTNPFLAWERLWADRDMRDGWTEYAFHAVYGMMGTMGVNSGDSTEEVPAPATAPAGPEAREALARIGQGGYAEAVIRMMILLAQARGGVRRSRLARSNAMLTTEAPFAELTASARQALIREQTVIASMAPAEALATLPKLLPKPAERRRALAAVEAVAGPEDELGEAAQGMLAQLRSTLAVKPVPIGHESAAVPD
jgi:tellurite resistance protein